MSVHTIQHPLVQHKLGLMRRAGISTKSFRELAGEVAKLLTYEATSDMQLEEQSIPGWNGQPIPVKQLKGKKVTVVPILRAGLGMLDGVTDLIPSARISVVGPLSLRRKWPGRKCDPGSARNRPGGTVESRLP